MKIQRLLIPISVSVTAAVVLAACTPGSVTETAATPTVTSQPEAMPTEMPAASATAESTDAPASDTETPDVPAEGPEPEVEDAVIKWSRTVDGACQAAAIGSNNIAFGPCDSPSTIGELVLEERAEDLDYFVNQFASFAAETPAGMVEFSGQGDVVATAAEQRMIAEWAQLAAMEAAAGRSDENWGLIFTWHREGGIAGFCEDVAVYVTGVAHATSCAGNEPQELGRARLNANQLATVFNWVDTLQSFEYEHKDPATADALTIRIVFSGTGNMERTEDERQAMGDLAVELLAQAQSAPTE